MAFNVLADLPKPVQLSQMGHDYLRSGVYFLWQGETVVYVGQSKRVRDRVLQHAAEGLKAFDAVSFMGCEPKELIRLERHFIECLLPKYNRCAASESVRRTWSGHMDDRPLPDGKVGPEAAARILDVTLNELRMLHRHGLAYRHSRVPRSNMRRTSYSIRDLHQFAAQRQDAFRAIRAI